MKPYYETDCGKLYHGDVLDVLRSLPDQSVNCCVTSPPYWGLRDYGLKPQVWGGKPNCRHDFNTKKIGTEIGKGNWSQAVNGRGEAQGKASDFREPIRSTSDVGFCKKCGAWLGSHGLEPTPELYVDHESIIFKEILRVITDDGTCWINLGDSYSHGGNGGRDPKKWPKQSRNDHMAVHKKDSTGLKPKDLVGIPWRVAFALQSAGWYLRQDIIWIKPNPMPESVKDRCTKAHEYIFLLSKSRRYFYDYEAVKEDMVYGCSGTGVGFGHGTDKENRGRPRIKTPSGWDTDPGAHGNYHKSGRSNAHYSFSRKKATQGKPGVPNQHRPEREPVKYLGTRNKRSVWTCSTRPFPQAHFATFPPALIEPCILAGCPKGGIVLDPFIGSGTTATVAHKHDRKFIGIELNKKYLDEIAIPRIESETAQLKLFA